MADLFALQHTHWQIAPVDVEQIQGEDDLHQCIRNILSTRKGSDVLRPEFGSNHFDYIDQPYDVALPNMVREIHQALTKWEQRIAVQHIHITGTAPQFHLMIEWAVKDDIARQIYRTHVGAVYA